MLIILLLWMMIVIPFITKKMDGRAKRREERAGQRIDLLGKIAVMFAKSLDVPSFWVCCVKGRTSGDIMAEQSLPLGR